MNKLSVEIDGFDIYGWKSATLSRSLSQLCGSFSLEVISKYSEVINDLYPGQQCYLYVDGRKEFTGYTYTRQRSFDASSSRASIGGRDKTSDLVDSSIDYKRNTWRNTTLEKIISDVCKDFGISVSIEVPNKKISKFVSDGGETPYSIIERLCTDNGILKTSTSEGNVRLFNIENAEIYTDTLEEGLNILSASESLNSANIFSEYTVRGQISSEGDPWNSDSIFVERTIKNTTRMRHRPKVLSIDSLKSGTEAAKKAEWEMKVRNGKISKVIISTQSFYQSDKKSLWRIGNFVNVKIPSFGIEDIMLIEDVGFSYSEQGSIATLGLVNKNTYLGLQ